jgi:hypothetical protein
MLASFENSQIRRRAIAARAGVVSILIGCCIVLAIVDIDNLPAQVLLERGYDLVKILVLGQSS